MLLLARTTPADKVQRRGDGLSVFIVDIRASLGNGLEIKKLPAMINHNTTEPFFDGPKVPAENHGSESEEGKGCRYILDGMNTERILIASEALGDAGSSTATEYAKSRIVFERPIGQNQGVQFPIALAFAETEAADLMVRKAAALFDAGASCGAEANGSCSPPTRHGMQAKPACRRMAASAWRANTMSSANGARRGSSRSRRSRPISSSPTSPSTCSACRGRIS